MRLAFAADLKPRQAYKNDPIAGAVVEERQLGEVLVVRDENTL